MRPCRLRIIDQRYRRESRLKPRSDGFCCTAINAPSERLSWRTRQGRTMRVLITGGAGFLGSHLCDAILAEGHSAICVDNLLTGRMENLAHLAHEPRFEFVQQD